MTISFKEYLNKHAIRGLSDNYESYQKFKEMCGSCVCGKRIFDTNNRFCKDCSKRFKNASYEVDL